MEKNESKKDIGRVEGGEPLKDRKTELGIRTMGDLLQSIERQSAKQLLSELKVTAANDPVRLYLMQACTAPLLTWSQESALSEEITRTRNAWRREVLSIPFVGQKALAIYEGIQNESESIIRTVKCDHIKGDKHNYDTEPPMHNLREELPSLRRLLKKSVLHPEDTRELVDRMERIPLRETVLRDLYAEVKFLYEALGTEGTSGDDLDPQTTRDLRASLIETPKQLRNRIFSAERKEREWIEARKPLAAANTRLVVSIAKRYRNRGLEFLDLIEEGNEGLMRALDKYEPERELKFSTYATWWIRQAITRAIADKGRTIRVPVHMLPIISKIRNFIREYGNDHKRKPTKQEIAAGCELDIEIVARAQKLDYIVSLNKDIGESGDDELSDFIPDDDPLNDQTLNTDERILLEAIREALSSLTPREAEIIILRTGLPFTVNERPDGRTDIAYTPETRGEEITLEETGKRLKVTRERIRQLERKVLQKLQDPDRPHHQGLHRLEREKNPELDRLPRHTKLPREETRDPRNLSIAEAGFPTKVIEKLEAYGIFTVGDYLTCSDAKLTFPGFGPVFRAQCDLCLSALGLKREAVGGMPLTRRPKIGRQLYDYTGKPHGRTKKKREEKTTPAEREKLLADIQKGMAARRKMLELIEKAFLAPADPDIVKEACATIRREAVDIFTLPETGGDGKLEAFVRAVTKTLEEKTDDEKAQAAMRKIEALCLETAARVLNPGQKEYLEIVESMFRKAEAALQALKQ